MGDMVFVKVSLYRHVTRFRQKGKLVSRFIWPFKILEYVGKVAYQLALLISIKQTHNVFHVSLLYKYNSNLSHVLRIKDVEFIDGLVYEECPI